VSNRTIRTNRVKNASGAAPGYCMARTLFAVVLLLGALAFVGNATMQTSIAAAASDGASVTRVDPPYVCMVNDRSYPKPQIAVPVDDRTYYGCCEMCKTALGTSTKHRSGIDPVTGNSVDKASAVIGALPDGRVHYFESESSFRTFNTRESR
jgi:YHS domain-containing protein